MTRILFILKKSNANYQQKANKESGKKDTLSRALITLTLQMNWKTKTVILFAKLRKPIEPCPDDEIPDMRRKAERAAWIGSLLFDEKTPVATVINEQADGVPIRIY